MKSRNNNKQSLWTAFTPSSLQSDMMLRKASMMTLMVGWNVTIVSFQGGKNRKHLWPLTFPAVGKTTMNCIFWNRNHHSTSLHLYNLVFIVTPRISFQKMLLFLTFVHQMFQILDFIFNTGFTLYFAVMKETPCTQTSSANSIRSSLFYLFFKGFCNY